MMSKPLYRKSGEVVKRKPGSCFLGTVEESLDVVRIPAEDEEGYDVPDPCMICDDPHCQEWANVEVVAGPHAGNWLCHLSDCQTEDLDRETAQRVINELLAECRLHRKTAEYDETIPPTDLLNKYSPDELPLLADRADKLEMALALAQEEASYESSRVKVLIGALALGKPLNAALSALVQCVREANEEAPDEQDDEAE